jgi:hypothetical protein
MTHAAPRSATMTNQQRLMELELSIILYEGNEFDRMANATLSKYAKQWIDYDLVFGEKGLRALKRDFYECISVAIVFGDIKLTWVYDESRIDEMRRLARVLILREIQKGLDYLWFE